MVPPVELIWRNVLPTPSPVQNLCYVPRVNALLCSSKDGTLSMHTAYSGSLICSSLIEGSRRSDKGNILLQYFEPRDSIVIARGGLFNVRRRFEEVFLISDILEPPVKDPTDRVRLELTPHQASVFKSALNSGDNNFETFEKAGLRVISSENLPRLNNWPALILEGPYDVLASCVQHMLHMSQTNNSPLAQLAAAINSRLFRSILSDEVLTSLCYWQTKILMNIEQYRRISFCVWPHMDYQWATPEAMAAAGFYKMAMDTGDRVFCFLCDICLTNWEPTDEPWSEHNRHASHCPFVQSKSSSNVPIIDSRVLESARIQEISNSPIELIGSSTSEDFLITSTRTGDITIWDVSVLLRKTLDFKLSDLLSTACGRHVHTHEVEVHSACIVRPSSLSQPPEPCPFKVTSFEPVEHHTILGCSLSTPLIRELRTALNWMSERCTHTTENDLCNLCSDNKKAQPCVLVIRVYPLTIMGLMSRLRQTQKLRDIRILSSATATRIARCLQDQGYFPADLKPSFEFDEKSSCESHEVPINDENGDESDWFCASSSSVDDFSDGHLVFRNNPFTFDEPNMVAPDNAKVTHISQVKKALEFYEALGLQHLIDGDSNNLQLSETKITPDETILFPPSCLSEGHRRHRQKTGKPTHSETTNMCAPKLIELLTLSHDYHSSSIFQLVSILKPIELNLPEFRNGVLHMDKPVHQTSFVRYCQGLLTCLGNGSGINLLSGDVGQSTADNASELSGGLLLFGSMGNDKLKKKERILQ